VPDRAKPGKFATEEPPLVLSLPPPAVRLGVLGATLEEVLPPPAVSLTVATGARVEVVREEDEEASEPDDPPEPDDPLPKRH
jgi:hypothetical protein